MEYQLKLQYIVLSTAHPDFDSKAVLIKHSHLLNAFVRPLCAVFT